MEPSLADQVAQAANLLGLLLALVTLFTTEHAKRLADEGQRPGGRDPGRLQVIRAGAAGLALVTGGALAFLAPLARDVVAAIGDDEWQPVLGVFLLTYALLVALFVWQVTLGVRSG